MAASELNLTDADVAAIEQRLANAKYAATIPQPRPLTGREREMFDAQEAKRHARRAAAKVEEERAARERERAAERAAAEWERNAPARQRAKVALAKVGRRIQALEAEQEALYDQARELEREANR